MVGEDVGGDGEWEQVGAGVAGGETLAEVGGGDVHLDGVEDVDAGALGGSESEARRIFQGEAGAADDDPFGEREQALRRAPAGEGVEAVGADELEDVGSGHGVRKLSKGVDGIVGGAIGVGSVEG